MKTGIIDLGTNSMRLLLISDDEIERRKKHENPELIKKHIITTRIGRGLSKTNRISPDAIEDNIAALKKMKEIAVEENADRIYCLATEALRRAENSSDFTDRAKNEVGIDINIIEGSQEAEFGFKGAQTGIEINDSYDVVTVDIGGGSTEVTRGRNGEIINGKSLKLGIVVLTEMFSENHRMNEEAAVEFLKEKFASLDENIVKGDRPLKVLGIGGTSTSLSAMNMGLEEYNTDFVNGSEITLEEVSSLFTSLDSMTIEQRLKIHSLQPKRADVIPAGALILREIMKVLGVDKVIVSEYDNLDGVIFKLDDFVPSILNSNK